MSIYFLVLNMNKNPERYENITSMLNKTGCLFSRIEAIDGSSIEYNKDCKQILKCRPHLLNNTFKCISSNEEWVYDGGPATSFPGLNLHGHQGTKGLTLSNLKAFEKARQMDYNWYCILEDDAEITKEIYDKLLAFINNEKTRDTDMVLLDVRNYGFGGTAGMLYNKKILECLIKDLHPLSEFSLHMEEKHGLCNLWDWKLWTYLKHGNPSIKIQNLPCIPCADFASTING